MQEKKKILCIHCKSEFVPRIVYDNLTICPVCKKNTHVPEGFYIDTAQWCSYNFQIEFSGRY